MGKKERGVSINIPTELYDEIKRVGDENDGASVSYLVRRVMREWLIKNPVVSLTKPRSILPPDPGAQK